MEPHAKGPRSPALFPLVNPTYQSLFPTQKKIRVFFNLIKSELDMMGTVPAKSDDESKVGHNSMDLIFPFPPQSVPILKGFEFNFENPQFCLYWFQLKSNE